MKRAAEGLPPDRLVHAFAQAFAAVWRRAHQTLGDVTLTAIADRVLYNASEEFPILSSLKVVETGLSCEELREHAGSLPRDSLADGIHFVLVEFLTVLGSLTAEILTPALHAELSKLGPEETRPTEKESPVWPRARASEDGKS